MRWVRKAFTRDSLGRDAEGAGQIVAIKWATLSHQLGLYGYLCIEKPLCKIASGFSSELCVDVLPNNWHFVVLRCFICHKFLYVISRLGIITDASLRGAPHCTKNSSRNPDLYGE
jgi:hypothetical protein